MSIHTHIYNNVTYIYTYGTYQCHLLQYCHNLLMKRISFIEIEMLILHS